MDIKVGTILVSEPYSDDSYFKRSVILIVEHNTKADIGFILNKCLTINLIDLIEGLPNKEYTLCLGGPVAPSNLHYIHTLGNVLIPGAIHINNNIYWGGDFRIITQLIQTGEIATNEIKFFLGYSGWDEGQLAQEINAGDWGICNSYNNDIVGTYCDLWDDIVVSSENLAKWSLVPNNPEDN